MAYVQMFKKQSYKLLWSGGTQGDSFMDKGGNLFAKAIWLHISVYLRELGNNMSEWESTNQSASWLIYPSYPSVRTKQRLSDLEDQLKLTTQSFTWLAQVWARHSLWVHINIVVRTPFVLHYT